MRIYLHLSPNREIVPFNYQQSLVGAFHKWLGKNELHDDISLYSLSWLSPGINTDNGLNFPRGSRLFISSPLPDLHQKLVSGIFKDPYTNWGMKVEEVRTLMTPDFGERQRFLAQSPIYIQRDIEGNKKYFFHSDPESNSLLTETLQHKLKKAGYSTNVSVAFDPDYRNPYVKKAIFNEIDIKGTMCPVIVEGDPRAVQFAWEVGVGNSTGIGFGALR